MNLSQMMRRLRRTFIREDVRSIGHKSTAERWIQWLLLLATAISLLTTAGIILILISNTAQFFQHVSPVAFLTGLEWNPLIGPDKSYGVVPIITGTMMITAGAAVVALPAGLGSAIYLSEYASPGVRRVIKPILEILAGVPTVVYGYFALTFVTPRLLQPIFPDIGTFNALSASLMVGVMIIPMVSSLSEDAISAVPRSLRDGAYALGSTRFEVAVTVVVPAAFSGIISSFILALSRAIGETMIVAIAAGMNPQLTGSFLEPIQTMTGYIVQVSLGDTPAGSVDYYTIFAVGTVLFAITLIMNLISEYISRRYREVYR